MSSRHTIVRCTPGPARGRGAHAAVALAAVAVLALCAIRTPPAGARVASAPLIPTAVSLPDPGSAEADFVARINQLRASRGLGTLSVDPELTAQARQWAATMATAGRIYHSGDLSGGISANWQKLGENVGVGGDVGTLFQAFVDSPTHYANLVDPAYTRVGVGVVLAGDRLYTTHRFMAPAPTPPPPPPTVPPTTAAPRTAAPTTAAPTTTTTSPSPTAPPATTTTTEPPTPHKLGPLERIADLVAVPDDRTGPDGRTGTA